MIKVFTTNKEGKIEFTKEELKSLLDEAYWEGYRANSNSFFYSSPITWTATHDSTIKSPQSGNINITTGTAGM